MKKKFCHQKKIWKKIEKKNFLKKSFLKKIFEKI